VTTPPRMTGADWLALAVLSVLWGGTFLFVRIAVVEVPPLTLVLARVAIGSAVLLLLLKALGQALPDARRWRDHLGMGLLNNVLPFSLIFFGQTQITAGLAAILNATTPIWTVILLHVATRDERATPAKVAGVVLGLIGVVILVGPEALRGLGATALAQLAVIAGTISYAFSSLWARRLRGVPPLEAAAGQLTASFIVMTPLALVFDRPWTLAPPSGQVVACIVALGVVSTALAYILFFRVLLRAGGTNAALVTLLIPPTAIFLGAAVLGEALDPRHAAGLLVILTGLVAIDGRLAAAVRRLSRARQG
jgi:drug/metabolite transporter (DMT)-like permease